MIEGIYKAKSKLEADMIRRLKEFQAETGLCPTSLHLETDYEICAAEQATSLDGPFRKVPTEIEVRIIL